MAVEALACICYATDKTRCMEVLYDIVASRIFDKLTDKLEGKDVCYIDKNDQIIFPIASEATGGRSKPKSTPSNALANLVRGTSSQFAAN